MYNPRYYAIRIGDILNVSLDMVGKIESNPLEVIDDFLEVIYVSKEDKQILIDKFDINYSKYKNTNLANWAEEDTAQMIKDLREIVKQ